MIRISGFRWNQMISTGYMDLTDYLIVNCCGYEKYVTRSTKTFREQGLADYQIIYMVKGKGHFRIGDNMEEVTAGQLVLFRPHEVQQYAYQSEESPQLYWVHFTGYGASDLLRQVGLGEGQLHNVGIHNSAVELIKTITLELQLKAPLFQPTADAKLMELLAFLGRKKLEHGRAGTRTFDLDIQQMMEQMHAECHRDWNIAEIAKSFSLSPKRFMHKFKEQTGFSAIGYVTKIRIDKAKDLLLNSPLSVKEIANIIGYENPLYFSRLFSKMEGMSPRDYRKHRD